MQRDVVLIVADVVECDYERSVLFPLGDDSCDCRDWSES